ncbi:class I SAM-dependent methyltransferase [Roseibium sp. SCP14]|uniref:class I SAM-dependent methyltransferase n=1 Tax=Roseibium sp. SCP14 TaxID=3141375 RepID=UPI00333513F4
MENSKKDNPSYGEVWDLYLTNRYEQIRQKRNRLPENRNSKINFPGDEWGGVSKVNTILDETFPDLSQVDELNFVEIGSGGGRYTVQIIDRYPKATVHAFDVSSRYLDVLGRRLIENSMDDRVRLTQLNENPDFIIDCLDNLGLKRQIDVFYSFDAMVHVDLQTLTTYFMTAALTLSKGGAIVMNVADATSDKGLEKLFVSSRRVFAEQGRCSAKFLWYSPDIVSSILEHLGFCVVFLNEGSRDCYFKATLVDPQKAEVIAGRAGFKT